jgi:hypothetical protein
MRRVRAVATGLTLAAQLVMLVSVPGVRGASILWTLIASPLTASVGVERVFTLTATNEDPLAELFSSSEIGCVVVDVPGNFTVAAAVVTGSNSGDGWHVDSIAGNRVTVHTDSGGDRLELLGWVRFTITATPFNTGSLTWNARAYRQQDCTGGAALVDVPPIVVVTGSAPTPTPVPTPPPTPVPTPKPTPSPTPRPAPTPAPLPLPSLPLPLPSLAMTPTPGPEPTGPPSSSAPRPSSPDDPEDPAPGRPGAGDDEAAAPGAPQAPSSGAGAGGGIGQEAGAPAAAGAPRVEFDEGRLDLGAMSVDLLAGVEIWSVPAATLGVPGILLLIWVALQAVGALAWIPAVRRLRGDEDVPPG